MERENPNRSRNIGLRLTPDEYAKIEQKWKSTTCRKLSQYVRRLLFEKPVTTTFRNKSVDDFLVEMAELRTALNHIGNNFNQAVKRLHTLNQLTEFKNWISVYDIEKKILFNKVDEIKKQVQKIAEAWLQ